MPWCLKCGKDHALNLACAEMLKEENKKLKRLIWILKRGDCWCEAGVGNPMMKDHSVVCKLVQKFINEAGAVPFHEEGTDALGRT
jgi:hypothetical protein